MFVFLQVRPRRAYTSTRQVPGKFVKKINIKFLLKFIALTKPQNFILIFT